MINKKYEEELLNVIQKASGDKKILREFLIDLLTPAEYVELATRWQVVKRLSMGIPQRTISKDLKIGIATVTRGSRELSDKKGGFITMIKKMNIK